ncbi:ParB/RepB/Spo0J family partition protein [Escherichia coli]|jgi:ParB family chromosome partitioning protein|uniref:ParB/RepB/Spo0J family partition protein n=1 Tax=Buttiauxella gaviniae TaxID=82990 RepID=UPI001D536D24|nr:ParB/RepB/Spo0J family partition protein [Escherichia coli]
MTSVKPEKKKVEKLTPRGRLTGSEGSDFNSLLKSTDRDAEREFTLSSGRKIRVTKKIVFPGDIESQTFINPLVNTREQNKLTKESLWDILKTIGFQQYFPAIGRMVGDRIEILDGSRRRAACVFKTVKFEVLVTEDELSLAEAQELSRDIQTAKEHSLREKGIRYLAMSGAGMTQEAISKAENISQTSVSRAIQAASVSDGLINLFPDLNELNYKDYKYLLEVTESLSESEQLAELESSLLADINAMVNDGKQHPEAASIISLIKKYVAAKDTKERNGPAFEPVVRFNDRRISAKVKTDKVKRVVSYEFKRLPLSTQERINNAIKEILQDVEGKEE